MDNEKIIRKPIRFHEKSLKLFAKASLLAREIGFTFVAKEMIYVCLMTHSMPMFDYFIGHGATEEEIYSAAENLFLNRDREKYDVFRMPTEVAQRESNSNQGEDNSLISLEERQEIIRIAKDIRKNVSYNIFDNDKQDDSQWLGMDVEIMDLNDRAVDIADRQYGTIIIEPTHMTVAFAELDPEAFEILVEKVLYKRNKVVRGKQWLNDISEYVSIIDPSEDQLINGRDIDITTLMVFMMKQERNSVLLVGEYGVGKRLIIEKFAWMVANGKSSPSLNNSIVLQVNANAIIEDESAEKVFTNITNFAEMNPKTILFIDGIQKFKDSIFLKKLMSKKIRVIGAVTPEVYDFYFLEDFSYDKFPVGEPHSDNVLSMVKNQVLWLERKHGVRVSDKLAEVALKVSYIFDNKMKNPGRFLNYLDRAMAITEFFGRKDVTRKDILSSFEFYFGRYEAYSEEYKLSVAFHELGHFFVIRSFEELAATNLLVSIFPKEDADGENHLREIPSSISFKDRNFYKQWISVFLAGRMAEEMFTNHVTSGASDDLSRATGIARDMVCEYALSNISNVNTFGMGENGVPYSQKTLEKIDVEVENILEEARKYCKEVLESNAEKIKLVANVLVKNGLLLTSEIEELLEEQSE